MPNNMDQTSSDIAGKKDFATANKAGMQNQKSDRSPTNSTTPDIKTEKVASTKTASEGPMFAGFSADELRARANQVVDSVKGFPETGRQLATKLDGHVRANPWLHVGFASLGGALIGYLVGRSLQKSEEPTAVARAYFSRYSDIPEGINE